MEAGEGEQGREKVIVKMLVTGVGGEARKVRGRRNICTPSMVATRHRAEATSEASCEVIMSVYKLRCLTLV
jgi:hypothetical protein